MRLSAAQVESLKSAINTLRTLSDEEVLALVEAGLLDELLQSLGPALKTGDMWIYDYLYKNRKRLALLTAIQRAIGANFCPRGVVEGNPVVVTASDVQWFEDGVMFLQGEKPFEGLIGLYRNGEVRFAISARDARKDEVLTKEHFYFATLEEAKETRRRAKLTSLAELRETTAGLRRLLADRNEDEREYQAYFTKYPWVFGAQHIEIQPHKPLDDANIPDFTGIRTRDGTRDVFEIKQPFLAVFRKDGELSSAFNDAWNQAERYLHFARTYQEYLVREKGLRFDNPHCFLIIGSGLSDHEIAMLRRKESMNLAITVMTYDDVEKMAGATVQFLQALSG